jgi:sirohydrochlorin cobaltochelatase
MKLKVLLLTVLLLVNAATGQAAEEEKWKVEHKNAIVLAMFGTTVEPALKGLLNIQAKMVERFPETPVRIAFTSNIIRKKWRKRAADPDYVKAHPEIPA